MGPFALWAFAGILGVYKGDDSQDFGRSLRRRFALVGLLLGLGLVAFIWDWTANLAVTGGAMVVIVVGLLFYSERAHRPTA